MEENQISFFTSLETGALPMRSAEIWQQACAEPLPPTKTGTGGWFPKVNIWRTNGNFCLLCPISQNQLQVICKGMLFSPLRSLYTVQFRKTSKLQLVCCPHKLGEDCRNINSFGGGILPQQENKAGGYPQQYCESAFTALLLLPLAFSQNWWG